MIPYGNALLFQYQSDKNTESILATSTRWSMARKRHLVDFPGLVDVVH